MRIEQSTDGATVPVVAETCLALKQLHQDPILQILRESYTYLGTARLHHCVNCDEEWVIFKDSWPQAGCGTIALRGYQPTYLSNDYPTYCMQAANYSTS